MKVIYGINKVELTYHFAIHGSDKIPVLEIWSYRGRSVLLSKDDALQLANEIIQEYADPPKDKI